MSQLEDPRLAAGGRKEQAQRRGFGLRDQVAGVLQGDYHSDLIQLFRQSGYRLRAGDLRLILAREFGFCYGVDRAVELAYETVERFPGRRLFITAEIIHNPRVNNRLREMGVRFFTDGAVLDEVRPEDVVILPAFGASVPLTKALDAKGCLLVDTTCGSVIHVWKRVEKYAREGFTSVIHGTFTHEETIATSSRALAGGGKFLVVRDKEQAQWVCDFIEGRLDGAILMERLAPSASPEFNPQEDLARVGLANQTTMLASESLEIAGMIRDSIRRSRGEESTEACFRSFDTICSATQERQDAMNELREAQPNLVLVVGGFNSSNTGHLLEIAGEFAAAYHIDGPDCLVSAMEIRHKPVGSKVAATARDWLPRGPLSIGFTAGASTPNRVTGEVIERVLQLHGARLEELQPA